MTDIGLISEDKERGGKKPIRASKPIRGERNPREQ